MSGPDFPYVDARKSANTALASATPLQVGFDTVVSDPYSMKGNAAGQFFVIPTDGTYIVRASVWWAGETTAQTLSYRLAALYADPTGTGSSYAIFAENLIQPNVGTNSSTIQHVSRTGTFTKGTAIKCTAQQFNNPGLSININGGNYTRISIAMIPGKIIDG